MAVGFGVLGVPGTAFGVLFDTLGMLWRALGDLWISRQSLEGPCRFFNDLGCHFRGPGTQLFDINGTLDGVFSIHSFKIIPGVSLDGLLLVLGDSRI